MATTAQQSKFWADLERDAKRSVPAKPGRGLPYRPDPILVPEIMDPVPHTALHFRVHLIDKAANSVHVVAWRYVSKGVRMPPLILWDDRLWIWRRGGCDEPRAVIYDEVDPVCLPPDRYVVERPFYASNNRGRVGLIDEPVLRQD